MVENSEPEEDDETSGDDVNEMCLVLTLKNTFGQFDGKHYWLVDEERMTCIDQQFMDELHDNDCSNFGKWPTLPSNCSSDGSGDPHVNHEDPRREEAEIALFVWRVKNVVMQTKEEGKVVDVIRILEREHRNFPFELDMGPNRLLRYLQPGLDSIIHDEEENDVDSVWDICTDDAADEFEKLLKQVDGPYGAGKKGK